jgi:hypothetical protein
MILLHKIADSKATNFEAVDISETKILLVTREFDTDYSITLIG